MASTATAHTKQMASTALASFLQARTAKAPTGDASRALRRKQQRERKKRSQSHTSTGTGELEGSPGSKLPISASKKEPKKLAISKEERDIRQRILWMRENKRKGKPMIQPKSSAADSDDTDDDF